MKLESAIAVLSNPKNQAALLDTESGPAIRRWSGPVTNDYSIRLISARLFKALTVRGYSVVRQPRAWERYGSVAR